MAADNINLFIKAVAEGDLLRLNALIHCEPSVIDKTDQEGRTALMHAVINNRYSCMKSLLSQGADVLLRDKDQKTALMFSVEHPECCLYLLSKYNTERIDDKDKDGWTALMCVVSVDYDRSCIERLLQCGADIDAQNNKGETPLMLACASFRPDSRKAVEHLLRNYSDVHVKDASGKNALSKVQGDYSIIVQKIKLLIKVCSEADINQVNFGESAQESFDNESPIARAVKNKDYTFLTELLKCGADPKLWIFPIKYFHHLIRDGRCDIIQLLAIKTFCPENAPKSWIGIDNRDETVSPLYTAVHFNQLGIARYLIVNSLINYGDISIIQNHKDLRISSGNTKSPWPLQNLAYVMVSETARGNSDYKGEVERLKISAVLEAWEQREKSKLLCRNLWGEISLGFESGTVRLWADHNTPLETCYCHQCTGDWFKLGKKHKKVDNLK